MRIPRRPGQEGNQRYFGVKAHIGVDCRLQRRRPARADRARHGLRGLFCEGAAHAPEHLAVHRKRYAASARRRSRTTHPEVGRERRRGNREAKSAARRLKQDPSLRDGVPPQSTVGRFCIRGTGGGTSITHPQAPPSPLRKTICLTAVQSRAMAEHAPLASNIQAKAWPRFEGHSST